VESLLTQLAIVLVVRTRKSFWQSRPGALLAGLTAAVAAAALFIPYLPGAGLLGFVPLPPATMAGWWGSPCSTSPLRKAPSAGLRPREPPARARA